MRHSLEGAQVLTELWYSDSFLECLSPEGAQAAKGPLFRDSFPGRLPPEGAQVPEDLHNKMSAVREVAYPKGCGLRIAGYTGSII